MGRPLIFGDPCPMASQPLFQHPAVLPCDVILLLPVLLKLHAPYIDREATPHSGHQLRSLLLRQLMANQPPLLSPRRIGLEQVVAVVHSPYGQKLQRQ